MYVVFTLSFSTLSLLRLMQFVHVLQNCPIENTYVHSFSDLRLWWIYSEMNIIDICNFKNLNYKLCLIYVRHTLKLFKMLLYVLTLIC
jgi:hypothetical protein